MQLNNTYFMLTIRKSLCIGYFGGSITEGGLLQDETAWHALTTSWFKEKYMDCKIRSVQAAIGGTGSDLGIFRCDSDLLSHKPDLIFIEFVVNDYGKVV